MSLLFSLRVLTDLCYFVYVISSITSKFAHSGLLMTSLFIMAVAGYLCCYARQKRPQKRAVSFLPLLLTAAAFIFTKTAVDYILTIPMVIYLFVLVLKDKISVSYESSLDRFYLLLKIAPVGILFTVLASNKDGFTEVMLPYFFFFLIVSIMLLRMLRHSDQVNSDNKFRLMNTLEIGAVCGLGWLLSTGAILSIFKAVGNFTMLYILRPIFTGGLYVFGLIAWVFRKIFGLINIEFEERDLSELRIGEEALDPGEMAVMEFYAEEAEKGGDAQIMQYLGIAIGVIVFAVLAIILFRVLMRVGRKGVDNHFGDYRESIDLDPGEDKLGRSPRDRVRAMYRKFLHMCVRAGLDPDLNLNSRDVNKAMGKNFDMPAMDGLREVYIRARYSSGEITDDDVKTAKQMLERTRKAEKAEEKRRAKVDRSAGAGGTVG